mmetsp:Transcript_26034/g.77224  ORF Transcript_26034/g.77224 Transcript_26034/m.77224 type:complete len:218 (+) Transcript_26034:431-1084(+)
MSTPPCARMLAAIGRRIWVQQLRQHAAHSAAAASPHLPRLVSASSQRPLPASAGPLPPPSSTSAPTTLRIPPPTLPSPQPPPPSPLPLVPPLSPPPRLPCLPRRTACNASTSSGAIEPQHRAQRSCPRTDTAADPTIASPSASAAAASPTTASSACTAAACAIAAATGRPASATDAPASAVPTPVSSLFSPFAKQPAGAPIGALPSGGSEVRTCSPV